MFGFCHIMEKNDLISNKTVSDTIPSRSIWIQGLIYFSFAILMIFLNMLLQNLHENIWIPWISSKWGNILWIQKIYLNTTPIDLPEMYGSIIAVGVTYIIKFILDKYFVFQSSNTDLKETGKQFGLYFLFAIFTTLENLGIQLILNLVVNWSLNIRIIIALSCGYITKFILDRKFSFNSTLHSKLSQNEKEST